MRRAALILACVLAAGAVAPAAADEARCRDLSREAYGLVPRLFTDDRPDSLFGLILDWDDACGPREVIQRTRILAAVWDDAFSEDVYGEDILDDLAAFRRIAEAGRDPASDDPAERYDAFTMSLADQLLPHTDYGSLEAFFCLFYSGRASAAWELLDSDELAGSELARWYANEREILAAPRREVTVEALVGGWNPGGSMGFVGDKVLVGAMVGLRGPGWLLRMAVEVRVGRTGTPYHVPVADGVGYSDRFDAIMLGVEAGRVVRLGPHLVLDLFGGLGVDNVRPFKDEDLLLDGLHTSLGLGLRAFAGPNRTWMVGLDGRREWVGERNPGGTPLDGTAWSLRAAVGIVLDGGRHARLRALSP